MSGGYFYCREHGLLEVAEEIKHLIKSNEDSSVNSYGETVGKFYNHEIIEKFTIAMDAVKKTYRMIHEIDYLISGDTSEDTFLEEWKKIADK